MSQTWPTADQHLSSLSSLNCFIYFVRRTIDSFRACQIHHLARYKKQEGRICLKTPCYTKEDPRRVTCITPFFVNHLHTLSLFKAWTDRCRTFIRAFVALSYLFFIEKSRIFFSRIDRIRSTRVSILPNMARLYRSILSFCREVEREGEKFIKGMSKISFHFFQFHYLRRTSLGSSFKRLV